jgi:two-component system, response regulator PdtaR
LKPGTLTPLSKVLESRDDVRLLFTDIQMPGALDGMDLAREVHQRWPGVLLVITSGQKKPTEAEIPDHGRFVAKPYRAAELLGQVDDMIHKAREQTAAVGCRNGNWKGQ